MIVNSTSLECDRCGILCSPLSQYIDGSQWGGDEWRKEAGAQGWRRVRAETYRNGVGNDDLCPECLQELQLRARQRPVAEGLFAEEPNPDAKQ